MLHQTISSEHRVVSSFSFQREQETQEQLVDEELKNMQISTRPEDTKRGVGEMSSSSNSTREEEAAQTLLEISSELRAKPKPERKSVITDARSLSKSKVGENSTFIPIHTPSPSKTSGPDESTVIIVPQAVKSTASFPPLQNPFEGLRNSSQPSPSINQNVIACRSIPFLGATARTEQFLMNCNAALIPGASLAEKRLNVSELQDVSCTSSLSRLSLATNQQQLSSSSISGQVDVIKNSFHSSHNDDLQSRPRDLSRFLQNSPRLDAFTRFSLQVSNNAFVPMLPSGSSEPKPKAKQFIPILPAPSVGCASSFNNNENIIQNFSNKTLVPGIPLGSTSSSVANVPLNFSNSAQFIVSAPQGFQEFPRKVPSSKESSSSTLQEIIQEKLKRKAAIKALKATVPIRRPPCKGIEVDGYTISRDHWAKAFLQSDTCHSAGILFKALFSTQEIQNCTLRGRNGTSLLDLQKRSAIFRAVGWMKHKCQDPYSFDSSNITPQLTNEEKLIIEKKVFVERRYQTSRKMRDNPRKKKQNASLNPENMVVKPDPEDFYGTYSSDNSLPYFKQEQCDDEMEGDTEAQEIGIDSGSLNTLSSPPSPKRIKLEQME